MEFKTEEKVKFYSMQVEEIKEEIGRREELQWQGDLIMSLSVMPD